MSDRPNPQPRRRWALVLLVVPFVALLGPGWYARTDPRLSGVPFFIWYQFAWVILGVVVTGLVYLVDRDAEDQA